MNIREHRRLERLFKCGMLKEVVDERASQGCGPS